MARKAKRSTKSAKRRAPARKAAKKAAARRTPARKASRRAAAPAGHNLTPYLVIRGAADAIEFYKRALGAVENYRMPMPDGSRLMHAELRIGGSPVFIADEFPEMNTGSHSPSALGGTTASIHLSVKDIEAAFKRAVDAGMTIVIPLADTFWGDRFGKLRDPFGHQWSMGMQVRKLTPEQIAEGAKAAFAAKG
jgi:PhnB protein